MRILLFLIVFIFYQSSADINCFAQDLSKKVKINFKSNKNVQIKINKKTTVIDLTKYVKAAGQLEGIVVFTAYKNDKYYLLLDIYAPSRIPGGPGYCGAGEEFNLLWLKLSNSLKAEEIKSVLYFSCYETIEPDMPDPERQRYRIQDNSLKFDYISLSKMMRYSFHYDNTRPDIGFMISSVPFKMEE